MTKREIYIDDLKSMEDCLIGIEKTKKEPHLLNDRYVLRAVCRALYHLLTDKVKSIDAERRKR